MTASSSIPAPIARRLRAASPGMHGGASSLLRLGRSSDARLPSGAALAGWAERAAAMLDLTPMMVGPRAPALREPSLHEASLPTPAWRAQA